MSFEVLPAPETQGILALLRAVTSCRTASVGRLSDPCFYHRRRLGGGVQLPLQDSPGDSLGLTSQDTMWFKLAGDRCRMILRACRGLSRWPCFLIRNSKPLKGERKPLSLVMIRITAESKTASTAWSPRGFARLGVAQEEEGRLLARGSRAVGVSLQRELANAEGVMRTTGYI